MLKWSSISILYTGNWYSLPLVSSFTLEYNSTGAAGQRNEWVVLHLGTSCVPPWHCEIGLFCPFIRHCGAHKVTFVRYWGTLRFVSPNERGLIDSRLLEGFNIIIRCTGRVCWDSLMSHHAVVKSKLTYIPKHMMGKQNKPSAVKFALVSPRPGKKRTPPTPWN